MAGRNNWTREQTMMAFALYRILPSGKWDKRNPTVQRLADHIRRSPSAVALKLGNLASLDENRTTKGLTNCSRLDREIWEEYTERGDALVFESAQLLASALNGPDNRPAANGDSVVEQIVAPQIGYDRPALVTQRVNQQYFRNTLIHNYHDHCCITGIAIDPLLVASHIKPWKDSSPTEKVAASNGLLLNAFHDRAFDQDHPRQRFRDSCLAARRAHGNQRRMAVPLRRTAYLLTCRLQPIPRIPRIPSRAYLSTLIPKHPYN